MTKFPDDYKRHLYDHAEDIIEVAQVLASRHPELTLHECCGIVTSSHLDATLGLIFNTIRFTATEPVRKIK